jgi:hypothetical protein
MDAIRRPSRLKREAPASPAFDIADMLLSEKKPKPINPVLAPACAHTSE